MIISVKKSFVLDYMGFPLCFWSLSPCLFIMASNLPSLLVYSILLDQLFWENYPPALLFHPVRLFESRNTNPDKLKLEVMNSIEGFG